MQQDPRNIFVNQRQQYQTPNEPKTPPQNANSEQFGNQTQQQAPFGEGANNKANGFGQGSAYSGGDYQQKVAEMKCLAEKYQREGEGQLVRDIINSVIEQKARGQLSNDQLLTFAKRIYPLLNTEQRQRLEQLVEQLVRL